MINIDLLTISADGKDLHLAASIADKYKEDGWFIDSIYVDTQDTFIDDYKHSEKAFEITGFEKDASVDFNLSDENITFLGFEKDKDFLRNNLLFVFIEASNDNEIKEAVASCDSKKAVAAVYNDCEIKKQMMNTIKELDGKCSVPKNFIDIFLRWKALDLAICLQHFTEAKLLYNKFYKRETAEFDVCTYSGPKVASASKTCGCHE